MQRLTPVALLLCLAGCDEFDPPQTAAPSSIPTRADAGPDGLPTADPTTKDAGPDTVPDDAPAPKDDFVRAQAGRAHVWLLNPAEHGVAIVDAETGAVQQAEAGTDPAYLAVDPGGDTAIVIDAAASRSFVFRVDEGSVTRRVVDTLPGANAIVIAPDGKHAVLYANSAFVAREPVPGNTQEISVVRLSGDVDARRVTVGLRPSHVAFTDDGKRALVVTAGGLSVVDVGTVFDGETVAPPLSFGDDLDQDALRISLAPGGRHALAHEPGEDRVHLLDFETGKARTLELSTLSSLMPVEEDAGAAPDLALADAALSHTGTFALLALPGAERVVLLSIPEAFSDPSGATAAVLADPRPERITLSPGGRWAVIRAGEGRRLALLDLEQPDQVRRLEVAPDVVSVEFLGAHHGALLLHGGDEPGYSVLDLATEFLKFQAVGAIPIGHAYAANARKVFLPIDDPQQRRLHQVALDTLETATLDLDSPPTATGFVPDPSKVFVAQDHPDGRITLVDVEAGSADTLTGILVPERVQE